jgi:hypothetical protein
MGREGGRREEGREEGGREGGGEGGAVLGPHCRSSLVRVVGTIVGVRRWCASLALVVGAHRWRSFVSCRRHCVVLIGACRRRVTCLVVSLHCWVGGLGAHRLWWGVVVHGRCSFVGGGHCPCSRGGRQGGTDGGGGRSSPVGVLPRRCCLWVSFVVGAAIVCLVGSC